jgi:uncharacterized membrane protein YsdA (DUF1294 family)
MSPSPEAIACCLVLPMNVAAFLAFGLDKRWASRGRRRIPETTLLGLAWATGLAGGWLGMIVFRHKTRKLGFQLKMVLVTVLNLLWVVAWGYSGCYAP